MEIFFLFILSCLCMNIRGSEEENARIRRPIIKRQLIFPARPCVTPERQPGVCSAIARCPQLMLDLNRLRRSVCMQNLIVLGVCCPVIQVSDSFQANAWKINPPSTTDELVDGGLTHGATDSMAAAKLDSAFILKETSSKSDGGCGANSYLR
ncbi:hypothetical protein AVEN_16415-1 [Araneus ventricosus]|uniref:Clip domain-containing protein n=1 Tax=Araneus ventricosus TaxID=182803 RepID=A0A4Y2EYI4_ARAVE|nr:hypothetical protein AVEN_16415-1 [Araneus ventricosus]